MAPLGPEVVGHLFGGSRMEVRDDDLPGLLFRGLAGEVAAQWSPEGAAWTGVLREVTLQALRAAGTTVRLATVFSEAGVPHVVYKGVATSLATGTSWAQRMIADVDVLVDPRDLDQAEATLARLGLVRGPAYRHRDALTVWANCEVGWSGLGVPIDLHWRIDSEPGLFDIPASEVIAAGGTVELNGTQIPVMNPAHATIACAVHGTRDLWLRWRSLLDLMRLLEITDLDEVRQLAARLGAARSLDIGLAACYLAGVPTFAPKPDPAALRLASKMLALDHTNPEWVTRLQRRVLKFQSTDNIKTSVSGLSRSVVRQVIGP